jgi:hypothetical protein
MPTNGKTNLTNLIIWKDNLTQEASFLSSCRGRMPLDNPSDVSCVSFYSTPGPIRRVNPLADRAGGRIPSLNGEATGGINDTSRLY